MATYVVGDIQGCYAPLQRLLERIDFDPANDQLWSVGDIVNRGADNLAVVQLLRSLGTAFRCVLGNHDLHFLAVAHGVKGLKHQDTLRDLLEAPEREAIVDWFRQHPLAMWEQGYLIVHAGVPPDWTLQQTLARAGEIEAWLKGPQIGDYLSNMYGQVPRHFDESMTGWARARAITNALTRMRFCTEHGLLDLDQKEGPEKAPAGMRPWYAHAGRRLADVPVVFGHWALLDGKANTPNVFALDTGCVWGRKLTALKLEDHSRIACGC